MCLPQLTTIAEVPEGTLIAFPLGNIYSVGKEAGGMVRVWPKTYDGRDDPLRKPLYVDCTRKCYVYSDENR